MPSASLELFPDVETCPSPPGFRYRADFIDSEEESVLLAEIQELDFAPYEFRGVQARRRVVSFGLRHGYQTAHFEQAAAVPPFLKNLQSKAAEFASLAQDDFKQVLVSEYQPGTPIGWHKDRRLYGLIVGVSFASAAMFRFRRATEGGWIRKFQLLEPRCWSRLCGSARSLDRGLRKLRLR